MGFWNLKKNTSKKIIMKYCENSAILFSDDYFEACEEVKDIIKGKYLKKVTFSDDDEYLEDEKIKNNRDDYCIISVDSVDSVNLEDLGVMKPLAV